MKRHETNIKQYKIILKTLTCLLIICGLLGLLASFALTYDKIQVLKNPAYDPPCNINPILSCGSVMKTEQASLFGVPNTIFGLMSFSALTTFGVLLLAGAKVKKWVWQIAQGASLLGIIGMHYLFFQGVFRIHAICPWCFLIWMITIPIFLYITVYNLQMSNVGISPEHKISRWARNNHLNLLVAWYTIIFGIIVYQFWYYWVTLF